MRREAASVAVGLLIGPLLVLARTGLQSVWTSERLAVVFLLDRSAGVSAVEQKPASSAIRWRARTRCRLDATSSR